MLWTAREEHGEEHQALRALPTSLGFCWVVGMANLFCFILFVTLSLTLEPSMTSNSQQLSSCDLLSARIEGVSHRSGSAEESNLLK